jgi:hypothetical protein
MAMVTDDVVGRPSVDASLALAALFVGAHI